MRAPRSLTTAFSLAAVLGLAACGGDDEPSFSERTLKFTERETDNFGFTDSPPKTEMGSEGPRGFSNGDQLTFSSDLLDRSARDVGDLDVTCTVTRPGGFQDSHQNCQGTATLPGGNIALARGRARVRRRRRERRRGRRNGRLRRSHGRLLGNGAKRGPDAVHHRPRIAPVADESRSRLGGKDKADFQARCLD